jgi:hypothetical protein
MAKVSHTLLNFQGTNKLWAFWSRQMQISKVVISQNGAANSVLRIKICDMQANGILTIHYYIYRYIYR